MVLVLVNDKNPGQKPYWDKQKLQQYRLNQKFAVWQRPAQSDPAQVCGILHEPTNNQARKRFIHAS